MSRRSRWEYFRAVYARYRQADGESAVLAKIAAMPAPGRAMGERLHSEKHLTAVVNPLDTIDVSSPESLESPKLQKW